MHYHSVGNLDSYEGVNAIIKHHITAKFDSFTLNNKLPQIDLQACAMFTAKVLLKPWKVYLFQQALGCGIVGDVVAQWSVPRTWDQKVESSSPGRCTHFVFLGKTLNSQSASLHPGV